MEEIKKERNSSLELLRIICMILIITHHYSAHGGFAAISYNTLSSGRIVVQILSVFGKLSNSIFVLISGYFLITSDGKRHYRKIVPLMAEMLFYSVLLYSVMSIIQPFPTLEYGVKGAIKAIVPIFFGNWFVVYYILLYLLVPFLNPCLRTMTRKNYTVFVCILLVIWSIIPTFIEAYSFSKLDFFLVMYILGAYIRLHIHGQVIYKNRWNLLMGISCAIVLIMSVPILCLISYLTKNNLFISQILKISFENSIINVIGAVFIFMYFTNIHFTSKIVNEVAASVLGIYLIHDNDYVRPFIWTTVSPNADYVTFPYIHAFVKIMSIFIISFLIDYIRRKTLGTLFTNWFYKNCDCMIEWAKKKCCAFYITTEKTEKKGKEK